FSRDWSSDVCSSDLAGSTRRRSVATSRRFPAMIASRSLENCKLFMVSPPIWGTGCHCSETYKYHGYPFVLMHVLLPKPVPTLGRSEERRVENGRCWC